MSGALAGSMGLTVLQRLAGSWASIRCANTGNEYSTFALVLGMIGFLHLAAEVSVCVRTEYSRRAIRSQGRGSSLPLPPAEKERLSSLAPEEKRRLEQFVARRFRDIHTEPERAEASTHD